MPPEDGADGSENLRESIGTAAQVNRDARIWRRIFGAAELQPAIQKTSRVWIEQPKPTRVGARR
jgi:hypothetical protein